MAGKNPKPTTPKSTKVMGRTMPGKKMPMTNNHPERGYSSPHSKNC